LATNSFLDDENLQLIIFGGKGGVGKTTSAASTAVHIARTRPDKKVLVFSTDPAHSLSDSFDCQIGDKFTQIKGFSNLYAFEINPEKVDKEFRAEHECDLLEIINRASYLEAKDVSKFINLSAPGMDEVMAIKKIISLLKTQVYDVVVMDTAPTGHTLNLLGLPEKMRQQVGIMERSQAKHRYIYESFTRRKYQKDEVDKFLDQQKSDAELVVSLFTNSSTTEFVPVTIPEAMSISETERLLAALQKLKVPAGHLIVNCIRPSNPECSFCKSKEKEQEKRIKELERRFPEYSIIRIPLFSHEIRGLEGLSEFAEVLAGKPYNHAVAKPRAASSKDVQSATKSRMSDLAKKDLQLILFGGKGGVGKTSCSAATAVHLAKARPEKKILVFSTDPAHSLSDSFDCKIGTDATPISAFDNLYALEINPEEVFDKLKVKYIRAIHKAFDIFSVRTEKMRIEASFDKRILDEFIDMAPPGLDEIIALAKISDYIKDNEYDLIIIDTAPTGHLIRLLEMPDILNSWFRAFIDVLKKYREVMKTYDVMKLMLETKKKISDTQVVLMNPEKTEFVAVTIAEAMSVCETERMLSQLQSLKIPCENIIVNKLVPRTTCGFCAFKRKEELEYVKEISKKFSKHTITEVQLFPHEIRSMDNLASLAEAMYG